MKKFILPVLLFLMFIPFYVNAETCDTDKITISSITMENKSDNVYSVFDINGFRYGLFAYKEMNEEHSFGSNCLPSIEVDDIKILKEKISHLEICFPLTQIGNNWVCEFVDSEGNHIELTAPIV